VVLDSTGAGRIRSFLSPSAMYPMSELCAQLELSVQRPEAAHP
jgi:hypothetical protein